MADDKSRNVQLSDDKVKKQSNPEIKNGIDNDKIKKQAELLKDFEKGPIHLQALIGYGQGIDRSVSPEKRTKAETEDKQSIKKELAEKFAELLTERGMNTELTSRSAKNLCARSSNNMNQWFILNGYDSSRVQSLHLEIREKGFRNIFKIGKTNSERFRGERQPVW